MAVGQQLLQFYEDRSSTPPQAIGRWFFRDGVVRGESKKTRRKLACKKN